MILEKLDKLIETGELAMVDIEGFSLEVNQYIEEIQSESSSSSVYGDFDNDFRFGRLSLISLLTHYLDEKIFEWDVEYLMSIIEFNYEGEDEKVVEVLFNFSDPYLGYSITYDNVRDTIRYLIDDSEELQLQCRKENELREGYRTRFTMKSRDL